MSCLNVKVKRRREFAGKAIVTFTRVGMNKRTYHLLVPGKTLVCRWT